LNFKYADFQQEVIVVMDHHNKFIIYLNFGISLTVMSFAAVRILYGGITTGILLLAITFILTAIAVLLAKMQRQTAAKLFTILSATFYIYTVQIGVPVNISPEYFYFPAMMLSPLLFSTDEKKVMCIGISIPFFVWFATVALPYPTYQEPWIIPAGFQKTLQILNFVSAISLTGFILTRYQKYFKSYQSEVALRERLVALGEMANGVAHEINNPLTIILAKTRGHQKLLNEQSPISEKMKTDFEIIISTGLRISKIVNTMLALSRDASSEAIKDVLLVDIINDTLDLIKERLQHTEITLQLKIDESISINCRPSQISQALLNLIQNSIDALAKNDIENKWIQVLTQRDGDHVAIIVIDSGKGIDIKISEKIMTPFFTTNHTKKSLGLGLSLAHSIAVNHNGHLTHSIYSNNTKFILRIPLRQV
jgi:signal transduction histidine kinase